MILGLRLHFQARKQKRGRVAEIDVVPAVGLRGADDGGDGEIRSGDVVTGGSPNEVKTAQRQLYLGQQADYAHFSFMPAKLKGCGGLSDKK